MVAFKLAIAAIALHVGSTTTTSSPAASSPAASSPAASSPAASSPAASSMAASSMAASSMAASSMAASSMAASSMAASSMAASSMAAAGTASPAATNTAPLTLATEGAIDNTSGSTGILSDTYLDSVIDDFAALGTEAEREAAVNQFIAFLKTQTDPETGATAGFTASSLADRQCIANCANVKASNTALYVLMCIKSCTTRRQAGQTAQVVCNQNTADLQTKCFKAAACSVLIKATETCTINGATNTCPMCDSSSSKKGLWGLLGLIAICPLLLLLLCCLLLCCRKPKKAQPVLATVPMTCFVDDMSCNAMPVASGYPMTQASPSFVAGGAPMTPMGMVPSIIH